jgi:hypothetical protein
MTNYPVVEVGYYFVLLYNKFKRPIDGELQIARYSENGLWEFMGHDVGLPMDSAVDVIGNKIELPMPHMTTPIVGNPQYDDEFEEELSVLDFGEWLFRTGRGFVINLVTTNKPSPRPLHVWVEWFLDWSEYSDYKERHKDD